MGEFINNHRVISGLVVGSTAVGLAWHYNYLAFRDYQDEYGGIRSPVVTGAFDGDAVDAAKSRLTGWVESIPGVTDEPVVYADNAAVIAAAYALKAGTPINCPNLDQEEYIFHFIGEENNSSAKFCLQTDQLKVAPNDDNVSEVVMNIVIDPTYAMTGLQPKATVEAAFAAATQEECEAAVTTLRGFGLYLLHQKGLPEDMSAIVELVGSPGTGPTKCDTWTLPPPDRPTEQLE